ncbi:hypothetical protein FBZ99_11541 [Rhizobium sp. ERR 1071]|nr:hypothetical protein FBZ99_11541 [Rhizobium sp. ERR1071]
MLGHKRWAGKFGPLAIKDIWVAENMEDMVRSNIIRIVHIDREPLIAIFRPQFASLNARKRSEHKK